MNTLINGASGYIGYHLTNELLANGHRIYAICRSNQGYLSNIMRSENLKIICCDQSDLYNCIKDLKIDVWYQLLWEGARGQDRSLPEIQIKNESLYVEALKIAESMSVKKIIFTGTVYERFYMNILSDSEFNKHSFYIMSKYHAHNLTLQLSKNMNLEYIWVQFCHPVGQYMDNSQLIPYAVNAFKSNQETSFGSCENYFDIISVLDLVRALRILGERKQHKTFYYIGSGKERMLYEYIEKAADICEYKLNIGFGKRADDKLIFDREWFDITEFKNEFNFQPEMSFEEIIYKTFIASC